ncbi:AAA family ATPase [Haloplanus rubicundus]|uniref:AAA family ATPase n=1 Tax=Haloplanus rubicundus TaxID=1547898 RepID=UPI001300ADBB|nr:AAA family ATPase [Haloplanus rubicundus]
MILDRQVLDSTAVPDQELIVHRGRELEDCRTALDLLADAPTNSCLVIHGPPGTGKTMIACEVLRRLRQQDALQTAYVDCWEHYSEHHALCEVASALDVGGIIHRNSTPTRELIDALQATTDQRRVVVLDEAEMVTDANLFRTLRERPVWMSSVS